MTHHDLGQKWQSDCHIINDCRSQIDILIESTAIGEIVRPEDASQPSAVPIAIDMRPAMICCVHKA
jgi:hypothetical protein